MMTDMDAKLEASRKEWDDLAPRFDQYDGLMEAAWSELLPHLDMYHAESILEIGCGLGHFACAYVPLTSVTCVIKVTDLSPVMVEKAKLRLQSFTGRHLSVETANALSLEHIPSSSVDRYISNLSLQLVPDADVMLHEAHRVLNKEGIAAFTIWGQPSKSLMFSLRPDGDKSSNFDVGHDINQLKARLKTAGFSNYRIWSKQCIFELWDASKVVAFWSSVQHRDVEGKDKEWADGLLSRVQMAMDEGNPIGLEILVIIAKVE
jgi:ubiquinone/menaquinone biosynthesis C-methylase UbiE